jgi:hypothetical protein
MEPVSGAGPSFTPASGVCEKAAKAGKAGTKLSVAAVAEVCLRNERRLSFVTVFSFRRGIQNQKRNAGNTKKLARRI